MTDFKINDYVARNVLGVNYIGRVRKKEEDDQGLRIWVQFTPPTEGRGADRPYIEFKPSELEPVSFVVNPALPDPSKMGAVKQAKASPFLMDPDWHNPAPKTER